MKFEDDTPTVTSGISQPSVRPTTTVSIEQKDHSIEDILERPVFMGTSIWNTTTKGLLATYTSSTSDEDDVNSNSKLFYASLPYAITKKSKNCLSKLKGFTYFRADIKIRVMVNAMQCHQGRILMVFRPWYSQSSAEGSFIMREKSRQYLSCLTSMTKAEMNLESGTTMEMTIPYCMPYEAWCIPSPMGKLGSIEIYVLNELRVGGATADSVQVTVYGWFQNPVLSLPSSADPGPAWGSLAKDFTRSDFVEEVGSKSKKSKKPPVDPRRQMGTSEAEVKGKSGLVTTVSKSVAQGIEAAGELPVIGAFCKPLGWLVRGFSHVAEYFGWSKPTDIRSVQTFAQLPGKGFTHTIGVDNSVVLGCFPDNEIAKPDNSFPTRCDEMDLDYVKQISSMIFRWKWEESDPQAHKLGSFPVHPMLATNWVEFSTTTDKEYWTAPSMVCYLASMFGLWTGSLRFRFSVTKTGFHSGRILISYTPSVTTLPSFYDTQNSYTWVLDLRDSAELEIEIPYVAPSLWKTCAPTMQDTSPPTDSFDQITGLVTVYVLNPLVTAGVSVSDEVDINVWIAGGADLEFAVPCFEKFLPFRANQKKITPTPDPSASSHTGQPPEDRGDPLGPHPRNPRGPSMFYEQVGYGKNEEPIEHEERGLTTAVDTAFRVKNDRSQSIITIGERVTSLRQLCKRFGKEDTINASGEKKPLGVRVQVDNFWDIPRMIPTKTGSLEFRESGRTIFRNPISYISPLYAFWCGSKRYKLLVDRFGSPNDNPKREILMGGYSYPYTKGDEPKAYQELFVPEYESNNSLISWLEYDVQNFTNNIAFPQPPNIDTLGYDPTKKPSGSPVHFQNMRLNNVMEVTVPFYSQTRIKPVQTFGTDISKQELNFASYHGEVISAVLYSAGGDDFSFGGLYSPVPIITNHLNSKAH
jgi:hypothetical protein